MKIQIKNGRLIDPKNNIDAKHDLFIAAGKVQVIPGSGPALEKLNRERDAVQMKFGWPAQRARAEKMKRLAAAIVQA